MTGLKFEYQSPAKVWMSSLGLMKLDEDLFLVTHEMIHVHLIPMTGSLVYCAAFWPLTENEEISKLGFDDSKVLKEGERER